MSLISILVVLLIIGVLLWATQSIPMDPTIRAIIRVVVVVAVLLWLLRALGFVGSSLRL